MLSSEHSTATLLFLCDSRLHASISAPCGAARMVTIRLAATRRDAPRSRNVARSRNEVTALRGHCRMCKEALDHSQEAGSKATTSSMACLWRRHCRLWQPADRVAPQHVRRERRQPVAERRHVHDAPIVRTAHSSGRFCFLFIASMLGSSGAAWMSQSRTAHWRNAPVRGIAASTRCRSPCPPTGSHGQD